jgi:hypothetical protein
MANNRVFWAIQAVKVFDDVVHGVQSATTETSFALEQLFELGQTETYQNIEGLPEVSMTVERVLDGYDLLYELCTQNATSGTLLAKTNEACDVTMLVYPDDQENAEGTAAVSVFFSGMYISSLSYTFPVEGNATENITLVGNDSVWASGVGSASITGVFGSDEPLASEGVMRRQHVDMDASTWPTIIPGINGSGKNVDTAGVFAAHIQDVTVTVNLGREDLLELGRRKPYYRFVNFPVQVETTINITAGGDRPGHMIDVDSNEDNLTDETILVVLADGTSVDCGSRNKLQSVSTSGGDTGGGVKTIAYSFQNSNYLVITSP